MSSKEEIYQRCRSHLLEYVGFRVRTSYEIQTKIGKYLDYYQDISSEDRQKFVVQMLEELSAQGLFSDVSFAKKYIEEQFSSSQPKSPNEVRAFLLRKGVSQDNIAVALLIYDLPKQIEVVQRLINKKKLPKDKMKNFLLRKGFTFDCIVQALETI